MNEQQHKWNSSYSGRSARTMQAAFNPYCDDKLEPMPDPYRAANWALYIVGVVAVAVIVYFA